MDPIPFKIPVGVEYVGLVRLELPYVVVEFDKWSWSKFSKQVNEVKIPISEISKATFVKSLFQTRLDLQLRSMKTADKIPSSSPGLIKLQFARRHRKEVDELSSKLRAALAEQKLARLESEMRRLDE